MKNKIVISIAIFFAALFFIAVGSYANIRKSIDEPLNANDQSMTIFTIESGQGVKEIAANLDAARLISGGGFFEIYVWQNDLGSNLRTGEYELSPSMTIAEMVELFATGEYGIKSNEIRVSIPEGFSNGEITKRMLERGIISEDDIDLNNLDIDLAEYAFLPDSDNTEDALQGYLFPDTYNFYKGTSLEDVAEKMLDNFDSKLTEKMRQDIKDSGMAIDEVITLASIVEREAGNKEEMSTIASVFYNRLKIGQPLQSDATVNYVTGAGRAMPTFADLEIDSPYNTYKYAGLPPTPICNPGLDAIKAAIYPDETDYYYFLTTQDEEQRTYFSKTYEEHLRNKAAYLK
ncbi:MAG: endolytic transglycosylase MltG [Candidatus Pacebacteria bacterium]|nr:endolytic transglycosylase MltG [Candidatus Paceibacterota bacterium]